ncbi:RNA-directed DNA polymerase, eukaryota, reverse transcriptase zinc-binding domain protein [Tanacetum coccineum]
MPSFPLFFLSSSSLNLSTMDSTQASSSYGFKKIKLTIIPLKQLFFNLTNDDNNLTTLSPTTTFSSPTPPNEPSKTPSINQTSSSQENTSSSFQSKLQSLPPSSNEPTSPKPLNPLLDNISDVPPRPLNPQPLQSHPSLDITLSLSPITPLDHILDTLSPPSPPPPIMGHPLYYNYHDYHSVCAILESHVDISSLSKVCSKVFRSWDWTSNASLCSKGYRIILGWNLDIVNVVADLEMHKLETSGVPWILMGDFNMALNLEDYSTGSSKLNYAISDFKDCVYNIEVMDINSSGLHFTWNPKPKGSGGLLKKLHRIMRNTEFIDAFPGSYALFQPYIISGHSPAMLNIPNLPFNKLKLLEIQF